MALPPPGPWIEPPISNGVLPPPKAQQSYGYAEVGLNFGVNICNQIHGEVECYKANIIYLLY